MSVTLLTARTEVRSLLDEATALFWLDSEINSWVNQGCADVARRAEILWQEQAITVVANVQNYSFPVDFLNCHRAEFTIAGLTGGSGDQTFNLTYRGINQMDEIWGFLHSLPAAWPQWFTIRGNTALGFYLMLYPAPAAGGTLLVYYYRQAVPALADTANIDTLPGWEDVVYDYAVYKALRKAKRAEWQEAMQLYEANLQRMIDHTRNMTDQGEQVTTANTLWPAYAYADSDSGW